MGIRAVVFDIGGVLEHTPPLGVNARWERRLGLEPGDIDRRLADVWRDGSLGTITEAEAEAAIGQRLGLAATDLRTLMADIWTEYVGTANTALIEYCRGLRPRYRTGILSNSFVGARERELAAYHFDEITDDLVYSHEVGLAKPDPSAYYLSFSRLGVDPTEMVFVDDTARCVEAAAALGIHAIRCTNAEQVIADIEAITCSQ